MRIVGKWVGKARGMARHFRSGIDTMMREAELEEMEKKWREENERIMRESSARRMRRPIRYAGGAGDDARSSAPPRNRQRRSARPRRGRDAARRRHPRKLP